MPGLIGMKILLAEDEADVRRSIAMLLECCGAQVVQCEDGRRAFELYRPGEYGVVLTDYRMPGMLGDALAKSVKAACPSQRVVMLSGYPEEVLQDGMVPWFIDSLIRKPPPLGELKAALEGIPEPANVAAS